MNHQLGD